MPTFTAIDFETADHGPDSACAVGAVLDEDGRIVERYYRLIRPPRQRFVFTWVHGLTWRDVCHSPTFAGMWPQLEVLIAPADFLVAHNAPFDRGVLHACCAADTPPPKQRFRCTVQLARKTWRLPPARTAVCEANMEFSKSRSC